MPNYDWKCPACDRLFEEFIPLADYPRCAPCPTCQTLAERVQLPRRVYASPDAVVVYQAPDGSFRFPGEIDGASCAKYKSFGYQRIEARGFAEVRRLESKMNATEASHMARLEERRQALREHGASLRRSEVRRGIEQGFVIPETTLNARGDVVHTGRMLTVRLSDRTRDMLKQHMKTERPTRHPRGGDPGLHVEVYSNDRSNREPGVDRDGRRVRD